MTDRYINPDTGVNTGAGTLVAPWKDLEYALEGSHCTEGDTIYLMAGDYSNVFIDKVTANQSITIAMTSNAGAVTEIKPYNDATIDIRYPSNCAGAFFYNNLGHRIKWVGIGITNPNNIVATLLFQRSGAGLSPSMTFEDCYIDKGTTQTSQLTYQYKQTGTASTNTVLIERCNIVNCRNVLFELEDQSQDTFYASIKACKIGITGIQRAVRIKQNSFVSLINNSISFLENTVLCILLADTTANKKIVMKNNRIDRGAYYNSTNKTPAIVATADAADTTYSADIGLWDIKNNVFWDDTCTTNIPDYLMTPAFFNSSSFGNHKQMVMDKSNVAIKLDTTYANGRGDSSVLPSKALLLSGDRPVVGGQAWNTTKETGCFPESSGKLHQAAVTNTLCFFGDSISDQGDRVSYFNTLGSGITAISSGVSGTSPGAFGGQGYRELMTLMDYCGYTFMPEWGVLCIGVNNIATTGNPFGITSQRMADQIVELMRRMQYWGIKPVWVGVPSLSAADGDVTKSQAVNAIVEPLCKANGWVYGNVINYMIAQNASWQTVYYDNFATDLHPNQAGWRVMTDYALQLVNEAITSGTIYGKKSLKNVSKGKSRIF